MDATFVMEEYDDLRNAGNTPNHEDFLEQHPEVTEQDLKSSDYLYDLFHPANQLGQKGGSGDHAVAESVLEASRRPDFSVAGGR